MDRQGVMLSKARRKALSTSSDLMRNPKREGKAERLVCENIILNSPALLHHNVPPWVNETETSPSDLSFIF